MAIAVHCLPSMFPLETKFKLDPKWTTGQESRIRLPALLYRELFLRYVNTRLQLSEFDSIINPRKVVRYEDIWRTDSCAA